MAQTVKHLPAVRGTWVRSLGWEDPLEKEMATHSSTLAWKIPWTEEPGGLQSMGSQRVGHNWVNTFILNTHKQMSACKTGETWIRWADCIMSVSLILYYKYVRCYHWGNWMKSIQDPYCFSQVHVNLQLSPNKKVNKKSTGTHIHC